MSTLNSKGVLFCEACRDELCVKCSTIVSHIKSQKHITGVKRLEEKKKRS